MPESLARALYRAALEEETRRARAIDLSTLDPEIISAGHKPQCELLKLVNEHLVERIIALCSRRAAKTVSNCAILATRAQTFPGTTHLYFGPIAKNVKLFIWGPVWKSFRQKWNVGGKDDETLMTTRFGNGSQVVFSGTDDYRHVETFLGGKYKTAIVDEAQSQPKSVLEPLVQRILPPALSDERGLLMLTGTVPTVEAGLFYEIWKDKDRYRNWIRRNWNRFQNPHIESELALKGELESTGRLITDPLIRRDWFGEFVFSNELTAFRYDRKKAGYDGRYPSTLDTFAVGIDPGAHDRTAIVVWGWSRTDPCVYQVYEFVTKRDSATSMSDIAIELSKIAKKFGVMRIPYWYMDMGGSKVSIDTFQRDYGVPIVHAAKKGDRRFQVDRFSNLMATGKCKIIIGSALEEDLQRTEWDKDKREQGKFEWSNNWHPDVADAGRYGLAGYFDMFQPTKPKESPREAMIRVEEEAWLKSLEPPVEGSYRSDIDDFLGR